MTQLRILLSNNKIDIKKSLKYEIINDKTPEIEKNILIPCDVLKETNETYENTQCTDKYKLWITNEDEFDYYISILKKEIIKNENFFKENTQ